MTTVAEVGGVLSSTNDPALRILYFAALLRTEAGLGTDDVVVVGGSAIEVYTKGAYVSGDIDICAPLGPVVAALEKWEFKRPGREWVRLDWKIVVDLVGVRPSGSMSLTRIVETPYGPVRLGAVEDLLLGRLALIKFWNEGDEIKNVRLLLKLPSIDWSYLAFKARKENLEDMLTQLRPDRRRRKGNRPRTNKGSRGRRSSQ